MGSILQINHKNFNKKCIYTHTHTHKNYDTLLLEKSDGLQRLMSNLSTVLT